MGGVDPYLMSIFRKKMANPVCAHKVYKVLRSCSYHTFKTQEGAYRVVDQLAACCCVRLSPETREYAARWLMNCCVDPANPYHRRSMWKLVYG
ncbi:hypothetical protein SAMN05421736_12827 [Evansella caseinilytica]|uniref:Uncharacterized protein n=1 Tax=Evansella caseinilytica TaxID=1503961 RepID=A0A1H3UWY3_9BACI|nr:hypothetical protein [Evansella caseinilytica]SDZ66867.1 hypothetical protein SAMN05421736_12827 [Evansella caseinilytica]